MKRIILLLVISIITSTSGHAQQDAKLLERLDALMKFTQLKDLDAILDYTYPKIFKLAPRDQMKTVLQNTFDSEEYSCSLDSVEVVKVFPVFTIKQAQYAKITHSMIMRMKFKDYEDSTLQDMILPLMKGQFGDTNVRFDKENKTLVIIMIPELVAIKDEYAKDWTFVNYDEEDKLVSMLFSKEVIEKLKEYK